MKGRTAALAASCVLLAGCGVAQTVTVRLVTPSPSPASTAGCEAYLKKLAGQLGNVGTDAGRFQAAVNAESFAGTLGPACAVPGLTNAELMRLAAQAAARPAG